MTLATALSRAQFGLDAPLVRVEVHCGAGLPQFSIVGLAETTVRESRERVRAALAHCGCEFPPGRVTVNLAPADLPKEGGRFDLAVALGILAASRQLAAESLEGTEFYGELSLSGELRAVCGVLAAAVHAVQDDRRLVVPAANADEARVARGARVAGGSTLMSVCDGLRGGAGLDFRTGGELPACQAAVPDLADVRGQAAAKRALEIAAAGGHSLLGSVTSSPSYDSVIYAHKIARLLVCAFLDS
ncbi:MAG: magnesium chelatase domain-containing protein [Steroidobacteraceae bacterium]